MLAFLERGKKLHWIALAITALILVAFGRVLTDMANAGQWWIFPLWFAGVFTIAYFIGADEDRAYYHRAWRWITRAGPVPSENHEERRD